MSRQREIHSSQRLLTPAASTHEKQRAIGALSDGRPRSCQGRSQRVAGLDGLIPSQTKEASQLLTP